MSGHLPALQHGAAACFQVRLSLALSTAVLCECVWKLDRDCHVLNVSAGTH